MRVAVGAGIAAVGINCVPPQHVDSLLERARTATNLPLLVYPNHGRIWDGEVYEWRGEGVDGFAPSVIAGWQERGARGIGGCCGIGPAAIAEIAQSMC